MSPARMARRPDVRNAPSIVGEALAAPGQPLADGVRADMESRFGEGLGSVRVHSDVLAAASAESVGAHAYSSGEHIVFGAGRYSPSSFSGRHLLAHELAHVAQQRALGPAALSGPGLSRQQSPRPPALDLAAQMEFMFNQMSWSNAPPGAPIQDPTERGVGVGPARAPGYQVHSAIQVIDPQGRQVFLSGGAYLGGGGPHAEEQAIAALRASLPRDGSLRGGRLVVTVTQDPCGPGRHDCALRLAQLADEFGLQRPEIHVPSREAVAGGRSVSGPTSSRGAQRIDRPPLTTRRVEPAELAPRRAGEVPERVAPRIPERLVAPRTGVRGGTGPRRLGSLAGGAAMMAVQIVTLVADLIIQLIVIPYLERLQRRLEQAYRDELNARILSFYQQRIQRDVDRIMYCSLQRLREYEARGQQAYVNLTLGVVFEDTSTPGLGEIFVRQPPESIFDMDFYELELQSVTLGTSPVEESAGELTDTERNAWNFLTGEGGQLWRQSMSFSFVAPSSAEIEAIYGEASRPPPSCDCFIATACYGSALAPEVVALRRFRDEVLMASAAGRGFVAMYYALSPPVAAFLRRHAGARRAVRGSLVAPAAGIAKWLQAHRASKLNPGGRK